MRGEPQKLVQDALGHSTSRMTDIYTHMSPERVRSAVNGLLSGEKEDPGARSGADIGPDLGPDQGKRVYLKVVK